MQYIEKQSTHWLSDFLAISRERSDLSTHEAGFYVCLISRIWTIKAQIGKLGSLRECSDIERLENRPDFFKMLNLKIIKGIRDYVNQTAASAPVPRSRAPAAYAALRYKPGKEARIFVLSDETLRTARQALRLMDLRPGSP